MFLFGHVHIYMIYDLFPGSSQIKDWGGQFLPHLVCWRTAYVVCVRVYVVYVYILLTWSVFFVQELL